MRKDNGTGAFYTIEDAFPVGHGSKSVYIMNRYLKLTDIKQQLLPIIWALAMG